MSDAVQRALRRAYQGIGPDYPCLVWLADYLVDAAQVDFAAEFRGVEWTARRQQAVLRRLAVGGVGECPVERAMDAMARLAGWEELDGKRQGAVLVGVYRRLSEFGSPAIYDGALRWIAPGEGGAAVVLGADPERIWEVRRAGA